MSCPPTVETLSLTPTDVSEVISMTLRTLRRVVGWCHPVIVVAIVVLNYQGGPPVKSKLPAKRGNLSEFDRLLKTTADR